MKLEPLLEELELAAERLGAVLSYENLGGSTVVGAGGLCKVKGEYRVIIDKRATVGERVATLAKALAELDHGAVFLSPAARDAVDRYLTRRAS